MLHLFMVIVHKVNVPVTPCIDAVDNSLIVTQPNSHYYSRQSGRGANPVVQMFIFIQELKSKTNNTKLSRTYFFVTSQIPPIPFRAIFLAKCR